MGDLIGTAVEGKLYWVPVREFDRVRGISNCSTTTLPVIADMARLNALYMIANAGSGHIGSSFSSMEILCQLRMEEIDYSRGDLFFSSKGHDAPALYAVLMAAGDLQEDLIHQLRRLGGLPGHPDVRTPHIVTNTGSLGMGVSKAKGIIFGRRLLGEPVRVFVLTGDGELQEGQIWESLVSAVNEKLGELTVIVDHNKIQSDYSLDRTSKLGDIGAKFAAFGWHVERINGHDISLLNRTFKRLAKIKHLPKVVIADTIKGRGVSFMEGQALDSDVEQFRFHSGAPNAADYIGGVQEILDRINARLATLESAAIEIETVERSPGQPARPTSRLIPAYTQALLTAAERHANLVALDADLALDMGLFPFAERFPRRFIECGIAEQDMVSLAGGLARSGALPIVHSFSCFLTARSNEQIYNNATEHTRIVYVGGLSGVLPAGPGHSHQGLREISAIGGVPGMVVVAPSCPEEVAPLFDWCVDYDGPSFLRLASVPVSLPFKPPDASSLKLGYGTSLRDGMDVGIVSSGPVMLAEAFKAAGLLADLGIQTAIYNLPWLNVVSEEWIARIADGRRLLVTIDDHFVSGGHGEKIVAALARSGGANSLRVLQLGIREIPPCGRNDEVLAALCLDAKGISEAVQNALAG